MSKKAQAVYEKVSVKEQIAEFRMFHFKSLKEAGLDFSNDFISHDLYKFCEYRKGFYPNMIRVFYANLWAMN